ncbi:MAG TPA: methionyl-tRNA formyltransferase [Oligoflexia bacterium]|nr:methionyl-tRNA formyltransferase [Oligoflexia bacterium]HMP27904.1 methionyl-tRNA formyltransferase [Oligoflexia bacterium]
MSKSDREGIIFFGTPEFAAIHLEALLKLAPDLIKCVVTRPDTRSGRGLKFVESKVKELAIKHNLNIIQPANIKKNAASFISQAKNYGNYRLGIVVAYGEILPSEILELPQLGCINVHASILPRWRGAAPIERAILAGDAESGITIMQMDQGMDSGDIIIQKKIPIAPDETGGELRAQMACVGAELLSENLWGLLENRFAETRKKQDNTLATYASKILADDLKISFEKSCWQIINQIRAFSPEPAAFAYFQQARLKIFKAQITNEQFDSEPIPGKILISLKSNLYVACADGWIELLEVQPEGKKKMRGADFARGLKLDNLKLH